VLVAATADVATVRTALNPEVEALEHTCGRTLG
jgi:hypothetical protein